MVHHCNFLIIHCIDFRLGIPIKEFMEEERLLGDCDIFSAAGGVKSLLSPKNDSDRDFILDQINIAINLHSVSEIIFLNHTDCGAYKESIEFSSFGKECKFHEDEMRKAKEIILKKYPQLKVKMILGKILSSGGVKFEEVK